VKLSSSGRYPLPQGETIFLGRNCLLREKLPSQGETTLLREKTIFLRGETIFLL
jgi:hypothetical protein